MRHFWVGFEKQAADDDKKERASSKAKRLSSSLSGAIAGYGLGHVIANKAYGNKGHFWTPVAGAVLGSRAGSVLKDKTYKEDK